LQQTAKTKQQSETLRYLVHFWAFFALLFSYLTVVFFASHSTAGSSFHNIRLRTRLLSDLESETKVLKYSIDDFSGDEENLERYYSYIEEALERIETEQKRDEENILEAEKRMNTTSKYSIVCFVISAIFTLISVLIPILSFKIYDYF
jgi:hypothetical protein